MADEKEMERMKKYIAKTNVPRKTVYDLTIGECEGVAYVVKTQGVYDALMLMFDYGRAKGYRMAKAEVRT